MPTALRIYEVQLLCQSVFPSGHPPVLYIYLPQFYAGRATGSLSESGRPMNEEASAGEDLPRGPNLVSAKKRGIRRMTENYASKSALDREASLLDDSERFGLPPGPPLS